jgi:hypothetical protein
LLKTGLTIKQIADRVKYHIPATIEDPEVL